MRRIENKIWAVLFLLVPVLCIWSFIDASGPSHDPTRFTGKWWFPVDISTYGKETDDLFMLILAITGIAFVATEVALFWFVWKYGRPDEPGENRRGVFIHGSHRLEMFWTIIPACILLFIALAQMSSWKKIKFPDHFDKKALANPHAEVTAGQFEWRIEYPDANGNFHTRGASHDVNHLHAYVGAPIVIQLRSRDVLHSFFLPNFRLKQDAVPGMTIPVWFEATKPGGFELMCAELCGWGHYKMKGWLTVHKDKAEFDAWLKKHREEEEAWTDKGS